jgi:hypothetical protein
MGLKGSKQAVCAYEYAAQVMFGSLHLVQMLIRTT